MQVSADASSFTAAEWLDSRGACAACPSRWPGGCSASSGTTNQVPVASENASLGEYRPRWLALDTQTDKPAAVRAHCSGVAKGRSGVIKEHRFRMRVEARCAAAPAKIFHITHLAQPGR